MLRELRHIDTQILAENPYWQYLKDSYRLPDGSIGDYYYIHTPGSAMVVAVTDSGTLVMVRQYRYLNQRVSLEFPGGGISGSDGAEVSARRELSEETGYGSDTLTEIGAFNPMNGVTDEMCHVFVARGLKPAAASPDTTEEFEIVELTIEECFDHVRTGVLWDGMTIVALTMFAHYQTNQNQTTLS